MKKLLLLLLAVMAGATTAMAGDEIIYLSYIRSTGHQAFNTGYTHKANTIVEMDCNVVKDHSQNYEALFGGRLGSFGNNAFCFLSRFNGRDIPCFNRSGNEMTSEGFVYGERITLLCSYRGAVWYRHDESEEAGSVNTSGTADGGKTPMLLFNLNTSNTEGGVQVDTSPCVMTLYSCIISENGFPVREFVPAKKNGVVGLYDKITGSFSGSITSTPFEAGEVIDNPSNNPWGDKMGGWCGKPEVNGGKNVYYTVSPNEAGEDTLSIRKSPDAVGDCGMASYDKFLDNNNPAPWIDWEKVYDNYYINNTHSNYIVIEDGVTSIGKETFAISSIVNFVIIPASVTSIGKYAFNTMMVSDVACYPNPNTLAWGEEDPYSREYEFNLFNLKSTKLHVFAQYLTAYQQKFSNLNATFVGDLDDFIDGVAPIRATEEKAAIYNLAGQRLDKPQKGINIIGDKKILVK